MAKPKQSSVPPEPEPIQHTIIERATATVPPSEVGGMHDKFVTQGWRVVGMAPEGDRITITAEREAPTMPAIMTPQPPPTTTGGRLRAAREAAGLTGRHVARAAMMAPSFVSDFENDRREPDLDTIWRYCLAVGVDPASIDRRLGAVAPDEFPALLAEAQERQRKRGESLKAKRAEKSAE